MPTPKNHRWVCPTCGKGKHGPSKLRKVDVRRYCLSCSEKAGVLVERSIPKLDKKRAVKRKKAQTKSAAKAKAKRDRERPERERALAIKKASAKRAADLAAWRERLTRYVTTYPDRALYREVATSAGDQYRRMGITILRHYPSDLPDFTPVGPPRSLGTRDFVPRWALELITEHTTEATQIQLGRFVTSRPELEAALVAVCAADKRRVLPYIVGQYFMPLPRAIVAEAKRLQAEIYGEDDDADTLGLQQKRVA